MTGAEDMTGPTGEEPAADTKEVKAVLRIELTWALLMVDGLTAGAEPDGVVESVVQEVE